MPLAEPQKKPSNKNFAFIAIILVVLLTAFALMAANALKKGKTDNGAAMQQTTDVGQQGDRTQKVDIQSLVSRVSQLIMVKTDEQPTVATVQDADILRQGNPLFYKDAENGDRLLVWSDKAVLYSVKLDKLLAVMPIAMGQSTQTTSTSMTTQSQTTSTASTVASEKAVIEVRNGTMTVGLGKKLASLLKSQGLEAKIVTDAQKKNYTETVIYKISDKPLDATLAALVQATKAKILETPTTETGVKGDVLVVVGSDYK